MLLTLPDELLLEICEYLELKDLKSFSLVSKKANSVATPALWRCFQPSYEFIKQREQLGGKTRYIQKLILSPLFYEHSPNRENSGLASLYKQLEPGQLRCLVVNTTLTVFSQGCLLAKTQPQIKDLVFYWQHWGDPTDWDLSPFTQLRRVKWSGGLSPLIGVLRNIEAHIERIQVVGQLNGLRPLAEFDPQYAVEAIFPFADPITGHRFPNLREIILKGCCSFQDISQFDHGFGNLRHLCLEHCAAMDKPLIALAQSGALTNVTKLELQGNDKSYFHIDQGSEDEPLRLLSYMPALRSLWASIFTPEEMYGAMEKLASHSMDYLILHFGYMGNNGMSSMIFISPAYKTQADDEYLTDWLLTGTGAPVGLQFESSRLVVRSEKLSPFAVLYNTSYSPEAMGITGKLEQMVDLVWPLRKSTSLKMLHIRTSGDRLEWGDVSSPIYDWTIQYEDSLARVSTIPTYRSYHDKAMISLSCSKKEPLSEENQSLLELVPKIKHDYIHFAKWVFSWRGIKSVDYLMCGDCVVDRPGFPYRMLLRRNSSDDPDPQGYGFHALAQGTEDYGQVMSKYGGIIRACYKDEQGVMGPPRRSLRRWNRLAKNLS